MSRLDEKTRKVSSDRKKLTRDEPIRWSKPQIVSNSNVIKKIFVGGAQTRHNFRLSPAWKVFYQLDCSPCSAFPLTFQFDGTRIHFTSLLSPRHFWFYHEEKYFFYFVSSDSRWRKIFAYASRLGLVFSETFFLSLGCLSLSTKLNHKSARAEHLFCPLCVRKTIASQRLGCFVLHYMSNSRLT